VTKFQSEDISPLHLVELGADVALRTLPNDNRLVQVMATQQHSREAAAASVTRKQHSPQKKVTPSSVLNSLARHKLAEALRWGVAAS
jgi:hypothetical protein